MTFSLKATMSVVITIRCSEQFHEWTDSAIGKFKAMFPQDIQTLHFPNVNGAAGYIEQGKVQVIFIEGFMEQPEANTLKACLSKGKGKGLEEPYIIVSPDNYSYLTDQCSDDNLAKNNQEFSAQYIFNCVRNLLTPIGQKLDIRYIKSILTSVINVIEANAQVRLVPGKITESKPKEVPGEIATILAFYGDGFLGSLNLDTTKVLITEFAMKMLFCEESDVNDDMLVDLLAEISNQILGVVRNELSEFGYDLQASLQTVALGKKIAHVSSSNGSYYSLPFTYGKEKFDLTFCYNNYTTSIHELEETIQGSGISNLDIRLVNAAMDSLSKVLEGNLFAAPVKGHVCQHLGSIYSSDSLHLFHAGSSEGIMTMALDVPQKTTEFVMDTMIGLKPEFIELSGVIDVFGEIINQIGGEFLKLAKKDGYQFQRIFHGDFASESNMHYLLKNPGYYIRAEYTVKGYPLIFCFGTNTKFADSMFNSWPYFNSLKDFKKQIVFKEIKPPNKKSDKKPVITDEDEIIDDHDMT